MKKTLLFAVVVTGLLALSTPASAITLLAGPMEAHFTDGGALFVDHDGDPATPRIPRAPQDVQLPGAPVVAPWADTTPAVGDENRSVVDVNQFLQNGTPYLSLAGGELTGLLYDLELVRIDTGVDAFGNLVFDLYYAPLGRNPLALDADANAGSGGVLELWLDPTPDGEGTTLFDPAGDGLAPFHWSEGGGPGGRDGYPTVNMADDSSLWLSLVFDPLGSVDTDGDGVPDTVVVMHEQLIIDPAGVGGATPPGQTGVITTAYMNIIGGSAAGFFNRDVFGPGRDMSLASTLELPFLPTYTGSPQDIGNWAVRSFDPVQADVIPEPATMTLLGLGLLGLGARIRRRK